MPHCFSLDEIMRMTNSFNKENLLSSWSVSSKSAVRHITSSWAVFDYGDTA